MNAAQFTKKIETIVDSETKVKKMFISCYKETVKDRFVIENKKKDIRKLISWVKKNNRDVNTSGIIKDVNQIDKRLNSVEFANELFKIIRNNGITRENLVKYNTFVISKWMKTQGIKGDSKDYQNSFTNYNNRRIEEEYREWSKPKFTIIDKYKGKVPPPTTIGVREARRGVKIVGDGKGAEKLRKADVIAQGGLESRLKSDYSNLERVGDTFLNESELHAANTIWKDNVFEYLKNNKLKPREAKRDGLYVLFVYLMTKSDDTSLDDIVSKNNTNINLPYAKKLLSDVDINIPRFREKLKRLINPQLDVKKLINYLESKGVPSGKIKSILDVINSRISKVSGKLTKRNRIDIIWKALKDNNEKLTRKVVEENFI
jgi:hypothetical protein